MASLHFLLSYRLLTYIPQRLRSTQPASTRGAEIKQPFRIIEKLASSAFLIFNF